MSEWLKEHAWKACVGETLPWVRIPLSPPISCFVPSHEQIKRLSVGGTKTSAIERAVQKHQIEQSALFRRNLRFVENFGLFCEF
jgi:hypothetical protein